MEHTLTQTMHNQSSVKDMDPKLWKSAHEKLSKLGLTEQQIRKIINFEAQQL